MTILIEKTASVSIVSYDDRTLFLNTHDALHFFLQTEPCNCSASEEYDVDDIYSKSKTLIALKSP